MSTTDRIPGGGSLTLEQLIALNDEMVAMVRAGVPLERGLILASGDLRGKLRSISFGVGQKLEEGHRLPEALAKSGYAIPELYRAIIEAGLRSGRLASALEEMARVARGYSDARSAVGMALLYPIIVVLMAYGLGLFFLLGIAPRFVAAFESLGLPTSRLIATLGRAGDSVAYWGPIVPMILVLFLLRWVWSGRSIALDSGPLEVWTDRLPWVGGMISGYRHAAFAETLALLIDHQVPIDEAVRLAAGASGGRALRKSAEAFSEGVRQGDGGEAARIAVAGTLPPLLAWMLTAGHRQADLATALRHAASTYQRKARSRSDLIRAALPTILMLVIGAGSVVLYALLLFVPMTRLYQELSIPSH